MLRTFYEFCKQYNVEFIYKTYEDFKTRFKKDIKSKYFNSSEHSYLSVKIVLEGIYKKACCHMSFRLNNIDGVWDLTDSNGIPIITNYSDEGKSSPILKEFLPDCLVAYMGIEKILGLRNNPTSVSALSKLRMNLYAAYDLTASVSALSKLGFTRNVGDIVPGTAANFVINTLTDLGTETFGGAQMETFYMNGNSQD